MAKHQKGIVKMTKFLPMVAAVVVIGVSTFLQGQYSERFGKHRPEALQGFTSRLDAVPRVIGDWKGQDMPIDPREFKASGCDGCVSRDFVNEVTGEKVSLFLVSGTARHVTIHTPDWCYRGAGFTMDGAKQQFTFDTVDMTPPPEAITARFSKHEVHHMQRLQIFWTFTADGNWQGPLQPKPAFAGEPALYKVYLITPLSDEEGSDGTAAIRFAEEIFPVLNETLFGNAGTPADAAPAEEAPEEAA